MPATRAPRRRLFLTSTMRTSFIEEDIATLSEHFDVDVFVGSGWSAPFEVLRRSRRADVAASWFASAYTPFMVFGARRARHRSAILLGGVDTACDRAIGYGIWRSRWRRPLLRYAIRNADLLLAVDPSLETALRRSSGVKDLHVEIIPTGYDADYWTADGSPREPLVLTVASCSDRARLLVKGVDVLINAARSMPDIAFRVVGVEASLVPELDLPGNVEVLPPSDRSALRAEYRRASVYCQPSRHEGLPNALCEAMLCGCIPVGSSVGGVPNAIGTTGPVVEPGDASALAGALRTALALPPEVRPPVRERISRLFPLGARQARLVAALQRLIDA